MTRKEQIEVIDRGLRDTHILRKHIMAGFAGRDENSKLNATHYRTLFYLNNNGDSCMHDVGRSIGLEAGSLTPVADRLVEEGLAERLNDPEDRRRILLSINDNGRQFVIKIKERIREHIAEKLSVLDEDSISELAEAMKNASKARCIIMESENE